MIERRSGDPVAITAALRGAGGYGKTTLARAVCYNEDIQTAFDDGILWVTLGENPTDLTSKVVDLIETLSSERPGFAGLEVAAARLKELLADLDILLVVDDVWDRGHLKLFLQGGKRCARLITTRLLESCHRSLSRCQSIRCSQAKRSPYQGGCRRGMTRSSLRS